MSFVCESTLCQSTITMQIRRRNSLSDRKIHSCRDFKSLRRSKTTSASKKLLANRTAIMNDLFDSISVRENYGNQSTGSNRTKRSSKKPVSHWCLQQKASPLDSIRQSEIHCTCYSSNAESIIIDQQYDHFVMTIRSTDST